MFILCILHRKRNVFILQRTKNFVVCKSVFLRLCAMKDSLKNFKISEHSFPKFPNTHEKEKFSFTE